MILQINGGVVCIDDADFDLINGYKWTVQLSCGHSYAAAKQRGTILMHRVIMNAAKGQLVDHRDRDGLNNQRVNLRFCTRAENRYNAKVNRQSTTRLKGVSVLGHHLKRPFRSAIIIDKKYVLLGYFATAQEAHEAYVAYSKIHIPDFMRVDA